MQQHIAYHAKSRLVDVFNIVVQGVPHLREAFVATLGLQVDDVDSRNARVLVHRHMVVANQGAQFVGEIGAITQIGSPTPHLVAHPSGIALRLVFLGESGIAATHHIQQDAIIGLVAIHMRVLRPIL